MGVGGNGAGVVSSALGRGGNCKCVLRGVLERGGNGECVLVVVLHTGGNWVCSEADTGRRWMRESYTFGDCLVKEIQSKSSAKLNCRGTIQRKYKVNPVKKNFAGANTKDIQSRISAN